MAREANFEMSRRSRDISKASRANCFLPSEGGKRSRTLNIKKILAILPKQPRQVKMVEKLGKINRLFLHNEEKAFGPRLFLHSEEKSEDYTI